MKNLRCLFRRKAPAAWVLVAVLVACAPEGSSPPAPTPTPVPAAEVAAAPEPRLALWVPCEGSARVLEHPERIPELLATARALGVSDLFVQVYRGGRAWYRGTIPDTTPHRDTLAATQLDTLAELLSAAESEGIRVHAWINALSLSTRRSGPVFDRVGAGAIMSDNRGRSVLDYPDLELPLPERRFLRMGTRQVWLDPGAPAVAATIEAIVEELFTNYPSLHGLHLDYIRYPDVLPFSPGSRFGVGVDFGYGSESRERFRRETGKQAPFRDSLANANAWDDWRRERVSEIVRRSGDAAKRVNPEAEISAAVWAYANRAYLSLFQDWRGWLDSELLDFAVPMAYTLDDRLLRYVAKESTGGVAGDRVWTGLGVWLFAKNPKRAVAQLDLVRSLEPAGISLFSYDALRETPSLQGALEESALLARQVERVD